MQLGDPNIRHSTDNLRISTDYATPEFYKAPTTSTVTTIIDDAEHDLLLLKPPIERWMGEHTNRQQIDDENPNEKR